MSLTTPLLVTAFSIIRPDTWNFAAYGDQLLLVSAVVLFIECGLLFPFLPGDTLLVAVGLFVSTGELVPFGATQHARGLLVVIVLFAMAAFGGNVAGYLIGRRLGPAVYARDGRIVSRGRLDATREFFDRRGDLALLLGRFVPFVRTYVTLVAGVTRMPSRRFLTWSGVGALVWVVGVLLLGYFVGHFAFVRRNVDYATLVVLVVTTAPVAIEAWRRRRAEPAQDSGRPRS